MKKSTSPSSPTSMSCRLLKRCIDDFDVGVRCEPFLSELDADTGTLDAAHRHMRRDLRMFVDPHGTCFERVDDHVHCGLIVAPDAWVAPI